MKKIFLFLSALVLTLNLNAQQKHPLSVEEMWKMKRIGDFDLSSDGKTIAFTVTSYSMEENKGNSEIYLVDTDGNNLHPFKKSDSSIKAPRFSPDGSKIMYEYKNQLWIADKDGSNEKQLTTLYTGASGGVWSKDGKKLLFVSSVYPDCKDQECDEQRDKAEEQSKVKAKIFTELTYRHWNEWRGDKRSHLFFKNLASGETIDLTPGSYADIPPIDLGSDQDYCFSPAGDQVAFTMNADAASKNGGTVQSISTNNDVMIINPIQGFPYKKISVSKGDDNQPVYSPDGKYIAFRSAARPGFESDKQALVLHDRSTNDLKNISGKFDLSIGQILWSPDSRYIYFDADREVSRTIYKFDLDAGKCAAIHSEGYNTDLKISADGKTIYFKKQRTTLPAEIFSMDENGGNVKQVTKINAELLADIQFGEFGTFRAPGANGAKIESIIITPPFFDPGKKYPLLFLIHGGPQGNWPDEFHYRWNLQMFAAKGYVVVAPNPRGSFGYGQKFTDEISGDWGGKVYTDLMNSCDYALKNFKYIDKNNTFAAGASYGGYMINWIEGHTSRFNALVCHDGVFDLESMWGSTEELWFPEWEFKGTPYTNKSLYEKWSPHRFAGNFKTPMLVVHGAMDFRVPESQAFELFTTLQRKGIPSKFLYFPDEFHFVVKPQNARLWWSTVFDWFNQYKK